MVIYSQVRYTELGDEVDEIFEYSMFNKSIRSLHNYNRCLSLVV